MGKIIRKALYYLLFAAAVTMFIYFSVSAGLTLKIQIEKNNVNLNDALIRFSVGFISLVLAAITQAFLLRPESNNEKKIFSIGLIAYFGIIILASILVMVYGRNELLSAFLIVLPTIFLSFVEISLGVIGLISLPRNKENIPSENENNPDSEDK